MAMNSEVLWRLQREHLLPFHTLLLSGNATADRLDRWLRRRGYRIERPTLEAYAEKVRGHAAIVVGAIKGDPAMGSKFIEMAMAARQLDWLDWWGNYVQFIFEAAMPAKRGR
ncbi:MAG TPA: hypothetical protein VHY37_02505 [Tepidisphaeraceae bacterium]|jgi:hypothetical protein|nr:hypothetical protein [Tepidisphaeraceae bacterium]